jgi:hypothetical protein
MKRHGWSLPWSGVRAAMLRIWASSSAFGPGGAMSRGRPERLVASRASGVERSLSIRRAVAVTPNCNNPAWQPENGR